MIELKYQRDDTTITNRIENDISLDELVRNFRNFLWNIGYQLEELEVVTTQTEPDQCHKCGGVSGVYLQICDDCMTRFNKLDVTDCDAKINEEIK